MTAETSDGVTFRDGGLYAELILGSARPGNPLGVAIIAALSAGLRRATREPRYRAVVLRSAGEAFCSGLDLEELPPLDAPEAPNRLREGWRRFLDLLDQLRRVPLPVIAAVRGEVAGGGVGLVAACDVVLAEGQSRFALPEVLLGLFPATIVPYLARRVSRGSLSAWAIGSRVMGAREALSSGLVDELAGAGQLEATVEGWMKRISRSHPGALARSKALGGDADEARRDAEARLEELLLWMQEPSVRAGLEAFRHGDMPPWFERHPETPCRR